MAPALVERTVLPQAAETSDFAGEALLAMCRSRRLAGKARMRAGTDRSTDPALTTMLVGHRPASSVMHGTPTIQAAYLGRGAVTILGRLADPLVGCARARMLARTGTDVVRIDAPGSSLRDDAFPILVAVPRLRTIFVRLRHTGSGFTHRAQPMAGTGKRILAMLALGRHALISSPHTGTRALTGFLTPLVIGHILCDADLLASVSISYPLERYVANLQVTLSILSTDIAARATSVRYPATSLHERAMPLVLAFGRLETVLVGEREAFITCDGRLVMTLPAFQAPGRLGARLLVTDVAPIKPFSCELRRDGALAVFLTLLAAEHRDRTSIHRRAETSSLSGGPRLPRRQDHRRDSQHGLRGVTHASTRSRGKGPVTIQGRVQRHDLGRPTGRVEGHRLTQDILEGPLRGPGAVRTVNW